MKKQNQKPKYSLAQNVVWMIRLAWKVRKRVLVGCILAALVEVLYNLSELYIAPEILRLVARHAPLENLMLTILFFTAALFLTLGIREYLASCSDYPRIDVRTAILGMIEQKANTTAYPNTLNADYIKLREKAHINCESNLSATEYIWQGVTNLIKNVGGFLVYLTILSHLNGLLLLAIIATCLVGFMVSLRISDWMYAHRENEKVYYARKNYISSKSQSTILAKDIRIFGLQNWLNDLLDQVHDVYLGFLLKIEKKWLIAYITEAVLTMARNAIAYVYLIHLTLKEGLSASEFLLYFTAVSTFTTWVTGILRDISRLHKDSLDISTVREYLEYPEPFKFEDGEPIPQANSYALTLDHVSFRYPEADHDTIHDMNLTIQPGEKLAIVGLNGAGKTTLIKLLCGLFDPTEGRVLLNGKDVRSFNRNAYYDLFSAVFQEFSIMDVTIAENVAQTATGIDYNKVRTCIEKAGLTRSIDELPEGLDSHVGRNVFLDGVLFSGGQTQRLMLARALYKDGPILILDEPTAALDPIAENDIYMKYNDMTAGKTSVFISHRLASTRFCDRIVLMSDGNIAESGTHESLLKLGGEYARLFEVQSRYYQEGRAF